MPNAGLSGLASEADRSASEDAYKAALCQALTDEPASEIEFFINRRRFDLMRALIGERLRQRPLRILNAACGPFAFEFYVGLRGAVIESFDHNGRLSALYTDLCQKGLIAPCNFTVLEVEDYTPAATYNIVLVNDLYYSKSVDFFATIEPLAASVALGGALYFDIQDERAGPLWRALGKDGAFRRYSLPDVKAKLQSLGLAVETVVPVPSIKGGLDAAARKALWYGAGIANNFAFVATRRSCLD